MQTIIVDMTPGYRMPTIYFSQGDVGTTFAIDLRSRFGDSLPASPTVTIQATKPSGFGFTVAATSLTNGVAVFTTTAEMTDEAGRFPAELKVVKDSVTLFSANFGMEGEANTHLAGTIDGSQEPVIPELTQLVERVEDAASSVLDMTVEAETLAAGSQATYSYDEATNTATFGIPQGEAGAGAAGVVASAYSASSTYAVGDYVIHNSNLYRCTTAITTAESFTAAHWTQVVLADDVTDLKSDISEIGRNYFDGDKFADGNYYSFSDGVVTVLREDARGEATIQYRIPLVAGEKYVLSVDYASANCQYLLYDPVTRYTAFYATLPNLYTIITPEQSGNFVVKIYRQSGFPITVDNVFVGKYEDWIKRIKCGITPNFTNVSGHAEAINRAISKANLSPFKTVLVPSGSYTLEKSIAIKSGVTLKSEIGTTYTLVNAVNAPMIINANRTTSSTRTDKNIIIDGGSWNGNRSGQDKMGTDGLVVGFWLAGVENLIIRNCNITNTRTYGILINNVVNVLAERLNISVGDVNDRDNGDGFHVIGPANNVALINSKIKSEDNAIAFNANDVDHGTYTSYGDIVGVTVENIQINNADGGQGMLLLSSHAIVKDVYINNIIGEAPYLLQMNSWNVVAGEEGSYENITVKNVSMKWYKSTWNCFIYGASGGTFNNILFENIKVDDMTATPRQVDALIAFYKSYTNTPMINNLVIKDVACYKAGTASGNWSLINFEQVNVLFATISGLNDRALRGKCIPIKVINATVYNLTLSDLYINSVGEKGWLNLYNSHLETLKIQNVVPTVIQLNGITADGASSIGNVDVSNFGTYFYGLDVAQSHSQLMTNVNVSAFPSTSIYDYFSKGQIVVDRNNDKMYLCTSSGITASREWQGNTAYGYLEKITYQNELYVCITAGTSGSSFSPTDGDFTDGTCKWRHLYGGEASFVQMN